MLKAYEYVNTVHARLHGFVIHFFDRIERETGPFSSDFFEPEFLPIVNRHRDILRRNFEEIYELVKNWDQRDKA